MEKIIRWLNLCSGERHTIDTLSTVSARVISSHEASEVILSEELFDRISDDSVSKDDFTMPDDLFIGVFDNGIIAGFFWITPTNSITVDIHCNILMDYRKNAVEYSKEFVRFMCNNYAGRINKLNCKIPVIFKDVYGFAKKCGFLDEGIDRQSILKNGEILDRYILGATLKELKKWAE